MRSPYFTPQAPLTSPIILVVVIYVLPPRTTNSSTTPHPRVSSVIVSCFMARFDSSRSSTSIMLGRPHLALFTLFSTRLGAFAQQCFQYGSPEGDTCLCPPGFNPTSGGNGTCSLPVCGGSLYEPGSAASAGDAGLGDVSSGCGCTSGWTGPGCTGTSPSEQA